MINTKALHPINNTSNFELEKDSSRNWKPQQKNTICFLGGNRSHRRDFKEVLYVWASEINLTFKFTDHPEKAMIRVGYEEGKSYTYIARDALKITNPKIATLNIGWTGKEVITELIRKMLGFITPKISSSSPIYQKYDLIGPRLPYDPLHLFLPVLDPDTIK